MVIFISVYSSQAQVSWMSKPRESSSYVSPVDPNLVFNSLEHRQEQYNKNVQTIQTAVLKATKMVKELNGVNDIEYKRLSTILENSIKKLNSRKRDYSSNDLIHPILKHFSEIETYSIVSRKYLLPDDLDFTYFQ